MDTPPATIRAAASRTQCPDRGPGFRWPCSRDCACRRPRATRRAEAPASRRGGRCPSPQEGDSERGVGSGTACVPVADRLANPRLGGLTHLALRHRCLRFRPGLNQARGSIRLAKPTRAAPRGCRASLSCRRLGRERRSGAPLTPDPAPQHQPPSPESLPDPAGGPTATPDRLGSYADPTRRVVQGRR
jgi:hypothetical protein